MRTIKKLNLLPIEIKNKYSNKLLIYTAGVLSLFLLLFFSVQYVKIGLLSWQTSKLIESNRAYENEKETIINLQESIEKNKSFMKNYEDDYFPFSMFMYDLEVLRPSDVFIISVDSLERLINEGKSEQIQKREESSKGQSQAAQSEEEAEEQTIGDVESNNLNPKIEYTEDLFGREIVIRGFGSSQESISKYIYDITHLAYIGSARITAIEEHNMENGVYNIFEITVTGGVYR